MAKKVVNVSNMDPSWNWIEPRINVPGKDWKHYSSLQTPIPKAIPKHESLSRLCSSLLANIHTKKHPDALLVSHGPRPTMYSSHIAKLVNPDQLHLSLSFTFTELPTGVLRKSMTKAYEQPTRFVTYSSIERKIYSDYFDIPIEKIDMLHWAVQQPNLSLVEKPFISGTKYISALGTEGRDYKTLFAAMKQLPKIKLVVVATEKSLEGAEVPENVQIVNNIPLSTALNILNYSEFTVIPLKSKKTTCGHGSIVSAMFHKKSILATNAPSLHDYIEDNQTGLYFEPQDVTTLKSKIESLWEDPNKTANMNDAAYDFALKNCTEDRIVEYFNNFTKQHNL